MEIKIKGKTGQKAKLAMNVVPENGTTVIQGVAPNGIIFKPSLTFKEVGIFPIEIEYHFMFHRRPWNIIVEFEAGVQVSTSNKEIGLSDTNIITPDILKIKVNFITQ